jgi:Tripartite tricarboxylate transporter family receptor
MASHAVGSPGRMGPTLIEGHHHPELSMHETRTAGIAADRLKKAGYEVTTGVGKTGVVGPLRNGEGPTVMLRADMDALPVAENTGLAAAATMVSHDLAKTTAVGPSRARRYGRYRAVHGIGSLAWGLSPDSEIRRLGGRNTIIEEQEISLGANLLAELRLGAPVAPHPGQVKMASNGTETTSHVVGELFKMMAGVDMTHVPFTGAGPVIFPN